MQDEFKVRTITLEGYEWQTVREALLDHRREWLYRIRDAKEGRRPGMSIEGAEMIVKDLDSVLNKLA
jgi:hypothetical protein